MALARAGHPAEAEALLAGAGRRGVPPPALARLAAALAAAGARTAAERVAARIRSPLVRARAYADVIAAAGDAGTVTRLTAASCAVPCCGPAIPARPATWRCRSASRSPAPT